MTAPTLAKIALLLLASPLALAQTPGRTLQSAQLNGNQLEITTSDGHYVIKPYSSRIVETTFIPQGERFNPASHAVVLAPGKDAATLKDADGKLEFATGGISVTVTKSPFRIAYAYKGKPLVVEKHGYYKKEGAEVIDFELDKDEALYGAAAIASRCITRRTTATTTVPSCSTSRCRWRCPRACTRCTSTTPPSARWTSTARRTTHWPMKPSAAARPTR
jgi:hypothetical protein